MTKQSVLAKNKKVIAAVGVVAAAAAAAGAYLLAGKRGAKNRQRVKAWARKAKAEIARGLRKAKRIDWPTYSGEIARVLGRYRRLKGVTSAEIAGLGRELKGYWKHISRDLGRTRTAVTKSARRLTSQIRRRRK